MTARSKSAAAALALTAIAGCGGKDKDDTAVRGTVRGYLHAVGARDGAAACAALTAESRERIGEFADKVGQPKGSGCAGTMRAFFASGAMGQLQHASAGKILSVSRANDRATVRVEGLGAPLTLRRSAGMWRIAFAPAVEADKLP